MANRSTLQLLERRGLHRRVAEQLTKTADWAAERGANLVVFGSFAHGKNRPGSDLDIGLIWKTGRNSSVAAEIEHSLDSLPTVRRIDVVDFSTVSPEFRSQAMRRVLEL